jgi:23S rRNA (adenine2030-N6)-methyltransferase
VRNSGVRDVHRHELCVAPDSEDFGMTGSGLLLVRPAYTLRAELDETLPFLTRVLGGAGAHHLSEVLVPE